MRLAYLAPATLEPSWQLPLEKGVTQGGSKVSSKISGAGGCSQSSRRDCGMEAAAIGFGVAKGGRGVNRSEGLSEGYNGGLQDFAHPALGCLLSHGV